MFSKRMGKRAWRGLELLVRGIEGGERWARWRLGGIEQAGVCCSVSLVSSIATASCARLAR